MPWSFAPIVTAASPVSTPARARSSHAHLFAESGNRIDEVERGADGAFGVVLVRHGRAPDRHHGIADELLDRAAVALDDAAAVEVPGESSRTSSESRASARVVKPTRSANRTETSGARTPDRLEWLRLPARRPSGGARRTRHRSETLERSPNHRTSIEA